MRPAARVEDKERNNSSAERSLRLLAQLAAHGQAMGLAELAQRLALPKATAHRLCGQLVAGGWLARDIDDRQLTTGPALRRLALDTLNHGEQRALRHAVLDALVQEVGETCNFTTLDGAEVVYLDRVEASWPLRLTLDVGAHVPLHCTASGKLFLTHMATARREALLDQLALKPMTAQTLTSRQQLMKACQLIRHQGYSTDNEEYIAGLLAVAVPVFDETGKMRAALALHAPSARMPMPNAVAKLPALQRAAARMAALL